MSRKPVLPLPPDGALEIHLAMQAHLPDAYQNWQDCHRAEQELREKFREPPGGRRWPETDPRRIEAIRRFRAQESGDAREAIRAAFRDLVAALFERLRSGDFVGYAEPASIGEPWYQIPRSIWDDKPRIASLRRSTVLGIHREAVKIVICRAGLGEGQPRPTGRPGSDAREMVLEAWRRRLKSGEALEGAHKEAAELIRIVKAAHPELQLPQKQTMAKWIRHERTRQDLQQSLAEPPNTVRHRK